MIGYIEGNIIAMTESYLIIKPVNSGIGYKVRIPDSKNAKAYFSNQDEVKIFTYDHYRENEESLWGFKDISDLNLFELLLSVQGVGPRTAQLLIYSLGSSKLVNIIRSGNEKLLKVPGIGPKTASNIIFTLKKKMGDFASGESEIEEESTEEMRLWEEAEDALSTLGYSKSDIEKAYARIKRSNLKAEKTEDMIKLLLKNI